MGNVRDTHILAQQPQLILQLLAARSFAHQRVVHLRSHLGHGLLELVPLRLGDTIDTVNHAIEDTRRLVNNADEKIDTVADELRPIVTGLNETLSAAEETLKHASTQLQGDTELSYQVNGTLNEVERAVRSLRIFLDYIERNPDALLRGKRQ